MFRTIIISSLAILLMASLAQAESRLDEMFCRNGAVRLLSDEKEATVYGIEMTGMNAQTAEISQCIGLISIIAGKRTETGYCKVMAPDGDLKLGEWAGSGEPGAGTWKWLFGVGKWQGVHGGGAYRPGPALELTFAHNGPNGLPTLIVPLCRGLSTIVFK